MAQEPVQGGTDCALVIKEVVNSSGGRTGCFLFKCTLLPVAEPRSCTPLLGRSSSHDRHPGFGFDGLGNSHADLAQYEGQELSLYLSYEEASPKGKRRNVAVGAPWRAILRDQQDDMLYCIRGLPEQVLVDAQLGLAMWGSAISLAFPNTDDLRSFAAGLCRVEVRACCLSHTLQAALLAMYSAERRLQAAASGPALPRVSSVLSNTCPASPIRDEAPRCLAGGKRKAEAPLMLPTPVIRARLLTVRTPASSAMPDCK